jgi:hypothetical protein
MKKQFFILSLSFLVIIGCKKNNTTPKVQTVAPNPLVAVAGPDTTLYAPLQGYGDVFFSILNGKLSHDSAGKIVSYLWTEVDTFAIIWVTYITSANADSTAVEMGESDGPFAGYGGGLQAVTNSYTREFQLEVQDDQKNVAYDTVKITFKRNFGILYDDLSWDSTVGSLTYITLGQNNPQLRVGVTFGLYFTDASDYMNICTDSGCIAIQSWQTVPYVSYDSIQLTTNNLFYTTNSGDSLDIVNGNDWPVIYARQNAGIDFTKKVSIGIGRLP